MLRADDLPPMATNPAVANAVGEAQQMAMMTQGLTAMQEQQNQARLLQVLGDQIHARGVPKPQYTSAQLNGVMPQNPRFFGVQAKYPIPYQNIVANDNNLLQVMRGYSETELGRSGPMQNDPAYIIQNLQRRGTLLAEAFNTPLRESLYSGVSRSPAINLYEIQQRNRRENSLYAFN